MIFRTKDYGNGIYSVTCDDWAKPDAEQMGHSVMQTWVIRGEDKIMAIDNGLFSQKGYRKFLEDTFVLPVMMVNSHGHFDHIGCNDQFEEVYLNKEDWEVLLASSFLGSDHPEMSRLGYQVISIEDKERIDLGNRVLVALQIKGHTMGSLCFFDEQTGALFSGDSISRRILYSSGEWVPFGEYFSYLDEIAKYPITVIYSGHDAFALPKDMPQKIKKHIMEQVPITTTKWKNPLDGKDYVRILVGGNEANTGFFDMTYPADHYKEAVNEAEALADPQRTDHSCRHFMGRCPDGQKQER